MATRIQLRRDTAANWTSVNPVLAQGEIGIDTTNNKFKIGNGSTAWASLSYFVGNPAGINLNDLGDVVTASVSAGDFLRWDGTNWINDAVNLSTDTVGDYVTSLVQGTGITISNNSGEGATPTIAIGQAVGTTSSVQFAQVSAPVTGNLTGNADTASQLQTARTISLSGDVSGSVSFNGSGNVDIAATVQPNSVALGTDTTGNYVSGVSQGTGVTVSHTPGEGSTASIAIGQDVATTASVSFAQVTTTGDITVGGNLTVNGTTTTLNTENLVVEDNIIVLNSNVTGSPSLNAGIEIERGDSANAVLRWNESTDSWEVTEDGSTYKNIAIGQDVETSSSVTFAAVTGPLIGNASTASQLATARTISLSGDLSGSVSFSGASDVTLSASVVNSGVSLDEISDVVVTSPAEFQSLAYNGTNWVNQYAPTVTYVRNAEATTLTTGTVVYLFGANGDHASVKRADNDSDATSSKTVGLVAASIAASENGPVVTRGYVDGIDLSTGYTAGDVLWLAEDGGFTVTKPSAPEHLVFVGVVVRASVNGIIYVATQNGYELEELHDVKISSPQNNDFLKYNSASAVWVNDPINLGTDTVGNYMADVSVQNGLTVSHTPGEGSTATVGMDNALVTNFLLEGAAGNSYGLIGTSAYLDVKNTNGYNKEIELDIVAVKNALSGSIALGTDTSGSYVASLVQGTGVTITNNSGEGATPTIAIGQSVATSASVEFYHIAMSGPVDSSNTVATKQYVDQVAAGIDWHQAVVLASTAALPNTPTYDNGTSGSGATLTASANARLVLDGANAVTDTRVLVKNQANATQNGVYDVTEQGSVSIPWVLTRTEDFDGDTGHEIYGGEAVFVTGGTVNIRQGFTVTSTGSGTEGAHEFGTDNVNFTQFTGTASFIAGDGLAQDGNTISVGTTSTDRITVSSHAIDLATVSQTNTTGSDGTSFVQSHSVDSYGRITGTVTATVQDGGTSQKGIARFNSDHFSVSSGSVSIGQAVGTSSSVTFAAVTAPLIGNADTATQLQTARTISLTGDVTGSVSFSGSANASITATIAANSVALGTDTTGNYVSGVSQGTGVTVSHTPGEGSTATISIGQDVATSATPTFSTINITNSASVNGGAINTSVSGSTVSLNMKSASAMSNIFGVSYTQGAAGTDSVLISLKDFAGANDAAAIRLTQSTSSVGVSIGPRVVINSASAIATYPGGSSSVSLFLNQSSSSVGIRIKDSNGAMGPAFEVVSPDISGSSVAVSIAGAIDGYRFFANSASLSSASVTNNLIVGGNLTVNGTTTTVNSTTVTIDDPIFTLGGDTAPGSDDNKDRGIEFRYHSGTAASVGFMGYDDSTGKFTFLTGATNTSEVFSGTLGTIDVGAVHINGSQIAASNLSNSTTGSGALVLQGSASISSATLSSASISSATLSGSTAVSGSVGFDASASVTLPAKTFFPEEYLAVSSSVTLNSTTHRYATLEMTASTGTSVVSVPTDASDNFPVGTVIQIVRVGAGEVQVTAVTPGTTTVNNALGTRLRAQWSTATLRKRAANTWLLSGDLKV